MNNIVCKCGSNEFEFIGTGIYKCTNCGELVLSNRGKMQKYLTEHPDVTVEDLVAGTGVTDEEAVSYLFKKPTKIVTNK